MEDKPYKNTGALKIGSRFKIKIYAPRWIVFMIDLVFSMLAAFCAFLVSLAFKPYDVEALLVVSVMSVAIRAVSFILGRTYSGAVRYTGMYDVMRTFAVLTIGEAFIVAGYFAVSHIEQGSVVPFFFFWIEYSILLCLMVFSRLIFKLLVDSNFRPVISRQNVIVYGSGEYLTLVKSMLDKRKNILYNIKGFIDIDEGSAGKYLYGIKSLSIDELDGVLAGGDIDTLIIASKIVDPDRKKRLIDACMAREVAVKQIPNLEELIDGTYTDTQLKGLNLEDLLSRAPIQTDDQQFNVHFNGRVIFVTGAAGSIGSEIVRQLINYGPGKIVLIDNAETPLYHIDAELRETLGFENFCIEMSDVRDYDRMNRLFRKYKPEIVYHAAAYKHVPMIENMPLEGVKTNIFGTKNVADLAVRYGCRHFVMVSTDKAVNPTNVMGCTKRIAEIYTQSLNGVSKTAFVTTRFGNVLGSNGSVIPRFTKQIESGGPVTVTHPKITRFFMTIPEACQLVLQAGVLGQGGEIFVFDMGESVKIDDLAKKMITLSGHKVGRDIAIVYTGLRPGEKLYEEVLSDKETVLPTLHNRIHRAKVREYDFDEVKQRFEQLQDLLEQQHEKEVVKFMKVLVPEYKSQNSVYEDMDDNLGNDVEELVTIGVN